MNLLWGLALGGMTLPLGAQPVVTSTPALGTRVQLEASSVSGRLVTGALTGMNQGYVSVSLDVKQPKRSEISVPWSRITAVNVSAGRDRRTGTLTGLLLGLGASIVVYPALSHATDESDSRLAPALVSFGALPLAGAMIGRYRWRERWHPLTWRPTQDTVILEGEATRLRFEPETPISIRVANDWVGARVLGTTTDSLIVRTQSSNRSFAWTEVTQINMRSKRSRVRGAALGMTLMGVAATATVFSRPPESRDTRIIVAGLLAGAAGGAFIGSPEWLRIPVPLP